jgi:hypothetical protein
MLHGCLLLRKRVEEKRKEKKEVTAQSCNWSTIPCKQSAFRHIDPKVWVVH